MRRQRCLLVLAVLVMLVGLLATPAHAGAPLKFTEEVSTGYPFYECGFEVLFSADLTYTSWTHFDNDGGVVRFREHVAARTATWTNPLNGRVLSSTGGAYTQTWSGDPVVLTTAGQVVTVTIPGEGLVFLDAGRLKTDLLEWLFVAGRHDFFSGPFVGAPPPEAFCAYLAG